MIKIICNCAKYILICISFILLSAALCSCKSYKQTIVTQTQKDSIFVYQLNIDSIYIHDSIYIDKSNDTITKYEYHIQTRYKLIRDTTSIIQIDSIPVIKEVEIVRTKNSKFAKFCIAFFFAFILAIIIYIIIKFYKH